MAKKEKEVLYEVLVVIKAVERMKRSGEMVSISWKRGKASGTTKTALSKDQRADWYDEKIVFECAFSRNDGQESFAEKTMLLIVNEEADKKTRKLGRAEIDLARYAQQAADKSTSTFTVSEPVSKDLIGDDDTKKDKKEKTQAASDGMKILLTLSFTSKIPAGELLPKQSGHKVSRSVDMGPMKLRKQASSPAINIISKDAFTPTPPLASSDPAPEKKEKKSKKIGDLRESAESAEKDGKEKKEKKEKEKKEKRSGSVSRSGDSSDSDRESSKDKKEKTRDRALSQSDNEKTPVKRSGAKSEMVLNADDMKIARASASSPATAPHNTNILSVSPQPPPMLGSSPMQPRRPGHRKTSSMSVAMINSAMSLDAPSPLKSPKRAPGAPETVVVDDSVLQQIEEDESYLIENVIYFMDPLYSHGWPLPSYIIFRSLLQWRAFDVHTAIMTHIAEAVEKIAQKSHVSQAYQAFWLASVSTLLYLIKKELQLSSSAAQSLEFKDFETKLTQSCTTLFITLLKACYAELDSILAIAFLEQPDPMQQAMQPKKQAATPESVIAVLQKYSDVLAQAHLFKSLIVQFFRQLLYYINGKLFNTLVEKRGLCRCGNGIQIKMGVSVLQEWVHRQAALESIRDQLESIRQSADVLVVSKAKLLEGNVRREVCPVLSHGQLHALLANYVPDEFDPELIDSKIVAGLAQLAEQSIGAASINVGYMYPLSLADLVVRKDFDFGSIEVPAAILSRPGYAFLKDNSRLADARVAW